MAVQPHTSAQIVPSRPALLLRQLPPPDLAPLPAVSQMNTLISREETLACSVQPPLMLLCGARACHTLQKYVHTETAPQGGP